MILKMLIFRITNTYLNSKSGYFMYNIIFLYVQCKMSVQRMHDRTYAEACGCTLNVLRSYIWVCGWFAKGFMTSCILTSCDDSCHQLIKATRYKHVTFLLMFFKHSHSFGCLGTTYTYFNYVYRHNPRTSANS